MDIVLKALAARHPAARFDAAPALEALNLSIAAGEQVAIIGPSGSGKTTLLHVLACALACAPDMLQLGGVDPWQLTHRERQALRGRLFLAPQVPPLPPRQRVVTAVLAGALPAMGFWRSLRSLIYPVDIPAAHQALDRFGVSDKLFERVDRLSGGERQRVALSRALLSPSSLWLVDEPLSALDPTRSRQAIETLLAVTRERHCTLVTTLHQVDVALAHFPRVIGLRDGHMAFDLPAADVSAAHLSALYAQHEEELLTPASVDGALPVPTRPAAMHCR